VITLDPQTVLDLPLDELALRILEDLQRTREWNEHNYLNAAAQDPQYSRSIPAQRAIAEALAWLRGRALIARTPGQSSDAAIFVTRSGETALHGGLERTRAVQRLHSGLHPIIESKARRQFLLGEYEQAVFVSMKAIEVRIRQLAGFGNELIGVDLINQAFGPKGVLTDTLAVKGEQEGTRAMFAGAYAVLRNPSGHREVDYDDVSEAAEAVVTASLLMRILDRIEARLDPG
jgi:uncharacterized protein (TIGR02391 family)